MSRLIPEDVIDEVRRRTDIVQVIAQHVELRRSGVNHVGRCPFHDEKTPSFNVNAQRQFYHCFGCHESGDVFRFLMKLEGRRFDEVVEDLAAKAGVELRRRDVSAEEARLLARRRSEKQQALDLNRRVADLYQEILWGGGGEAGRACLAAREISEQIARSFHLGFAPPAGSPVAQLLDRDSGSLELGERLGLVGRRPGQAGYHDRFWSRLIFPVAGPGGEIVGFSGRLIGDREGPKYINTQETPLYRKGEVLYGLNLAARAIRAASEAILVEGNFDVVQMHQHGFSQTVAPMGTALTGRQVELLRRFAHRVVALFDGDEAGRAAATKAVRVFAAAGVEARIAALPDGDDPDSLLRTGGKGALEVRLKQAQPAIDYLVVELRRSTPDTIPGRARMLEEVAPIVALLPSRVERDLYAGHLALQLSIEMPAVLRAIGGALGGAPRAELAAAARPLGGREAGRDLEREGAGTGAGRRRGSRAELALLEILIEHPHLVPRAEGAGATRLLEDAALRQVYEQAVAQQKATGMIDPAELLHGAPPETRDELAMSISSAAFATDGDATRALDDCIRALQRHGIRRELQRLAQQMTRARQEGKGQEEVELAARKVELERELRIGVRHS